ncbi:MAG: GNAT family N-acetyltransferase [Candidatus Ventricola sp.]|nr:GNAT family N-acetyltransferase [Candidatus Ventricola sp.]MDY3832104.1 GNAT family N-acetyltransferase [Candidatus Ventricola sp.]
MINENCPCGKKGCPRHGDCAACRAYHAERKRPVFCERESVPGTLLNGLPGRNRPYPVRRLRAGEIPDALALMWKVFLQFEAPEYSAEGIASFRASLEDEERIRSMTFYGAFDGKKLVGVLCMRAPQHIAGFFVDAAYHRRGIGRTLFETMRQDYDRQVFTVHSSPYAVGFYRRLGFVPTQGEQITNGLRYTPMRFEE